MQVFTGLVWEQLVVVSAPSVLIQMDAVLVLDLLIAAVCIEK